MSPLTYAKKKRELWEAAQALDKELSDVQEQVVLFMKELLSSRASFSLLPNTQVHIGTDIKGKYEASMYCDIKTHSTDFYTEYIMEHCSHRVCRRREELHEYMHDLENRRLLDYNKTDNYENRYLITVNLLTMEKWDKIQVTSEQELDREIS